MGCGRLSPGQSFVSVSENVGEGVNRILHRSSESDRSMTVRYPDWWWLAAVLRGVTLAQAGAVSLLTQGAGLASVLAPLALIAVLFSTLEASGRTRRWMPALEACLAGAVVGVAGDFAVLGLPYLVIPGFAAGLRFGLANGVLTSLAAGAAFVVSELATNAPTNVASFVTQVVQWGAFAVVLAVLGGWGFSQRTSTSMEDRAYETASRLLDDLRDLSPQLTAGLDMTSLADSLIEQASRISPLRRVAVVVDAPNGRRIIASRGADDDWLRTVESSDSETSHGRRGAEATRIIPAARSAAAWLVIDAGTDLSSTEQSRLEEAVRRQSLRIEAARAFADVRELAATEERLRIGREIHDSIAQDLVSVAYDLDNIMSEHSLEGIEHELEPVRDRIRHLIRDLRLSIFDLRDPAMETDLLESVSEHARRTAAAGDLELRLSVRDSDSNLERDVDRELSLIAREAITNVRRHAKAQVMWVEVVHEPNHASVTVRDDGMGIWDETLDPTCSGLRIMRERAAVIGARLTIGPRIGGGTVVRVEYGGKDAW
jgi:signal transduction histidine kinase